MQGNTIKGALFDLTVPGGMGGKEAISKLRIDFPDIPVLLPVVFLKILSWHGQQNSVLLTVFENPSEKKSLQNY
jgi:hypothetical protein